MTEAPLSREEQVSFMKDAPARHAAHVERWMKDDEIRCILSQTAGKTLIDDISDEDWLDEDKNCMINVGLPKKETK